MTTPDGGSRRLDPDPTASLPASPPDLPGLPPVAGAPTGRDVPRGRDVPSGRDVRPPGGARPAAAPAAGAVRLTPRERDGRDGPGRGRAAPLAWLPWALLAGLLVLLALMLLAGTLAGAERATRTQGGTAGGSARTSGPGTLVVDGEDLLASRQSLGRLASVQGQAAVGRGLRVQSVVADEGFWVGASAADRVFVYLTPQARQSSGESGFRVRTGQTVDVNGTVTGTAPDDPQRFGVTDAEGARQLTSQRAYVRASQVRLSSS